MIGVLNNMTMDNMIGKKITISGMVLEIVSDAGERWETLNTTTRETIFMEKTVLQNALRLAMAEVISDNKNRV